MARRNRRGQIRYYKGEPVRVLGRGEDPYFADAIEVKALGDSRQWYKGSVMTVPRSEVHARLVRRRRANRGRGSTPYKKNPIGSTILIAAATAAAGALAVYLVNRFTTKPTPPPALVVAGTAPDALAKAAAEAAAWAAKGGTWVNNR